ncbi:MAG: OmpA family protein [Candidatus Omnitrophica bacterium]|nr:OmpA family protein [Candidatus Omnitrophota bacterium]
MRNLKSLFPSVLLMTLVTFTLTGCSVIFQSGRRQDIEKIADLQYENQRLANEKSELERAKAELENRLRGEINSDQVKVEMGDRGLVITFLAEVLFDSGKAKLRDSALETLSKVTGVLNTTVKDLNIGIEGHTDNVPITKSNWKSNWELSTARALSVLHYMAGEQGLDPNRLSATGYGEYRPVADNSTSAGRQKNRRVEIVIIPRIVKKQAGQSVDLENLK